MKNQSMCPYKNLATLIPTALPLVQPILSLETIL